MRCIEIVVTMSVVTAFNRLTLTWDVLKYNSAERYSDDEKININMRCIEMLF